MVLRNSNFLWVFILLIVGCKKASFDDATKRNVNWAYWIDEKSGEGSWIRVSDNTTVDDGIYYLFYENGNLFEKGKIRNKQNVDTIFHYGLDEKLIKQTVMQSDTTLNIYLNDGPYSEYFQDETLFQKGTISNARFNDDWVRYYENGQIESNQNWVTGKRVGKSESWYENGKKRTIGYYENDKLHGSYMQWTGKGNIEIDGSSNNGVLTAKIFSYHDNGKIAIEGEVKEGKLDKIWNFYDETGKQIKKRFFHNDTLVNEIDY